MLDGMMGRKVGMTQIFTETGDVISVTVLELGPMTVIQKKTLDKDGYEAIQMGYAPIAEKKINRAQKGHLKGQTPVRHLKEFKADDFSKVEVGQSFDCTIFEKGQTVAVTGTSKGRGFSGVMKRHNFQGQPASHGHRGHRGTGSIGQRTFPGRVFKGKKMPGQYGNKTITTLGSTIVDIDAEKNMILIKGAVPGPNGGLVTIKRMPR